MLLVAIFATIAVVLVVNDEHGMAALFGCAAVYAAMQM